MNFFDSHTHLPDDCSDADAETIFREASEAGVPELLLAGTSLHDCPRNLRMAAAHGGVYTAVGIHPEEVSGYDTATAVPQLRAWLQAPHVVAIGEVGLDAHCTETAPADQEKAFGDCLRLAAETGFPVVIHCREAFERCYAMVQKYLSATHPIQVHSFADGPRELELWLKFNAVFSYNGMVTFKKAENIRETLHLVPLERLLLETDAPYLTPVPFRGQPNSAKYIPLIAARVAEERGLTLEQVAQVTVANAHRFFRIPAV